MIEFLILVFTVCLVVLGVTPMFCYLVSRSISAGYFRSKLHYLQEIHDGQEG